MKNDKILLEFKDRLDLWFEGLLTSNLEISYQDTDNFGEIVREIEDYLWQECPEENDEMMELLKKEKWIDYSI